MILKRDLLDYIDELDETVALLGGRVATLENKISKLQKKNSVRTSKSAKICEVEENARLEKAIKEVTKKKLGRPRKEK